jgi:hypothetical protein
VSNGRLCAPSWVRRDRSRGHFSEGPIAFINQRRNPPLPNDVKIAYQNYDWSLNEVK